MSIAIDEVDVATLDDYLPRIAEYPVGTSYTDEGRVVAYTDGSAVDTASRLTARAG